MRRAFTFVLALAISLSLSTAPGVSAAGQTRTGVSGPEDPTPGILAEMKGFDRDGDGTPEIEDLIIRDSPPGKKLRGETRLVLILVESRVLQDTPGLAYTHSGNDLLARLQRLQNDLAAEGLESHLVEAKVYAGNRHQDGLTVLALRRLLRAFRDNYPKFQGVIFVGSFPEPMIVRRWVWRKFGDGVTVIGGTPIAKEAEFLRIVPEIVSERSDIVLADLTGHWNELYQRGPKALTSIEAVPDAAIGKDWPKEGKRFTSTRFNQKTLTFEDFFFIDDADFEDVPAKAKLDIRVSPKMRHPELTDPNKTAVNPVARPEIFVSRINARHVAVDPSPTFRGIQGRAFLDEKGKPQTVRSAKELDLGISAFWVRDAVLERRLLIDYFDRNHAFRTGEKPVRPYEAAVIAYPKEQFTASKGSDWIKAQRPETKILMANDANLVDYVGTLKGHGAIYFLYAHSDPWGISFGEEYGGRAKLEDAVGGKPWRWNLARQQTQGGAPVYVYEPSLANQGGKADLYIHRTIYENGLLSGRSRLYIHNGCNANSPGSAESVPYNDNRYGLFQDAEGVLFYLAGVSVITRAKAFNDKPEGFITGLTAPDGHVGKGWRTYFEIEYKNAKSAANPAACKQCYNWSLLGDWTIKPRF